MNIQERRNKDGKITSYRIRVFDHRDTDSGKQVFKNLSIKYDNSKTDSPYRVMRAAQESGEVLTFQETLKDGSITEYDAQVSVKRTGGKVNDVMEFELTMLVQSDFKYTDPA